MSKITTTLGLLSVAALASRLSGCGASPSSSGLELFATDARHRWTGVAALASPARERVFVNYPDWNERAPIQVAELIDGSPRPYPDATWQDWSEGRDPSSRWVCVQSVHADRLGRLWVLDPAAPGFNGPVAGGPKLVRIDPSRDLVERVYSFDDTITPPGSYLNDVRIDIDTEHAFITDSGLGAIIVVNLVTGDARRLLSEHPLTTTDPGFVPQIGGEAWLTPAGDVPQIHSDGIALDHDRRDLYWQAITGRTLYRASLSDLLSPGLTDEQLASRVERVRETVMTDGMLYHGRTIYFSALERDAVTALDVTRPGADLVDVAGSADLAWPDSFAIAADGTGLVTSAQIHIESPFLPGGAPPADSYKLFRFKLIGR